MFLNFGREDWLCFMGTVVDWLLDWLDSLVFFLSLWLSIMKFFSSSSSDCRHLQWYDSTRPVFGGGGEVGRLLEERRLLTGVALNLSAAAESSHLDCFFPSFSGWYERYRRYFNGVSFTWTTGPVFSPKEKSRNVSFHRKTSSPRFFCRGRCYLLFQ